MRRTIRKRVKLAAFTICTPSYLSFARTLTDSFLKFHPEGEMFVLFLGSIRGFFDPKKEKFKSFEIEQLKNVKNLKQFVFKYDVIGLNTAVKPFFVEYLFQHFAIEKLIYFDTDILVFSPLAKVTDLLDKNNIVITPHVISPLPVDNKIPSEKTFLMGGAYNLGFIALSNTKETLRFAKWWQKKTYDGAVSKIREGFFRDQKPIDLAPSLFEGVVILKDTGYNVAYWNLHERNKFKKVKGQYFVNDKRLIFFHYSGYSLENSTKISSHQNRYEFNNFNVVYRELFELYKRFLLKNGYKKSIKWPYEFDYFDNGDVITDEIRNIYWNLGKKREKFKDPFKVRGRNSFYKYYFEHFGKSIQTKDLYWTVKGSIPVKAALVIAKKILGLNSYEKLTKKVVDNLFPKYSNVSPISKESHRIIVQKHTRRIGVNLFAHLSAKTGVGEAGRSLYKLLSNSKIPFSLVDIGDWKSSIKSKKWVEGSLPSYPISIFVTNANVIQHIMKDKLGFSAWREKYNIGYWHWELSDFPDFWQKSFIDLSEVWVSSDFCLDTISKSSPIPVVKVPWRPETDSSLQYSRKDFGFKKDEYVFLFIYDSSHYVERKNPLDLITAFKKANLSKDKTKLFIKTMNIRSYNFPYNKLLRKAIRDEKNILFSEEFYERGKVLDLINACDCYVSLHRSEGFGATIFEAMTLGKPVIATAYSGNMDFMNVGNSFPVKYNLIKIKEDIASTYTKGNVWAEPDVDHATQLMKYVYEHQNKAKEIGKRARLEVERNYSWKKLSDQLKNRIKIIANSIDLF